MHSEAAKKLKAAKAHLRALGRLAEAKESRRAEDARAELEGWEEVEAVVENWVAVEAEDESW
ncbi:hypothetical protein ACLX1H_011310 [Fusarium chlamydosporum]